MVNLEWWNNLADEERIIIQKAADASVTYEVDLLKKNTRELRNKIKERGMEIYYLSESEKAQFKEVVKPVWNKYEVTFTKPFLDAFLAEVNKY